MTLSLPAKVVLLIALTRPDGFVLPERMGPQWYGVSPDSIGIGLANSSTTALGVWASRLAVMATVTVTASATLGSKPWPRTGSA